MNVMRFIEIVIVLGGFITRTLISHVV